MKQSFHKIASVVMAVVVLMSTMSLTVFKHYCGTTLVDTGYFVHAANCGMESSSLPLEGCNFVKKDCCTDSSMLIEGHNELKLNQEIQLVKQLMFAVNFVSIYLEVLETEANPPLYRDYQPPPLIRPLFKIEEKYLI